MGRKEKANDRSTTDSRKEWQSEGQFGTAQERTQSGEMIERSFNFTPWVPPFSYDPHGTRIVDSKDNVILDVRGWGFLTGNGSNALGMNEEKACSIQDAIGFHVATLLNASSVPDASDSATASDRQRKRKRDRFTGELLPAVNVADDGCSKLPTGMEEA